MNTWLITDVALICFQVDQIPNLVTSVAFGLGGDVITGDASGRIFVWIKDNSDAFVVEKLASENMRHAHEVRHGVELFATCVDRFLLRYDQSTTSKAACVVHCPYVVVLEIHLSPVSTTRVHGPS